MDYLNLMSEVMLYGNVVSPRGQKIKELMHQELVIDGPQIYGFKEVRELAFVLAYWGRELAWYFSGDRDPSFITPAALLWDRIKNPDGLINSNYGNLIFYNKSIYPIDYSKVYQTAYNPIETMTPFDWAVYSLEKDKDSRQAVMTYNTGGFNFEGNNDYICTQHQAFFIRKDELNCYIALRSSDAIFGLTYNMPWWSVVHQQLFLRLKKTYPNLKLGEIRVTIYSAHIYEQHWKLVEKMLKSQTTEYRVTLLKEIPLGKDIEWYVENIPNYIKIDVA